MKFTNDSWDQLEAEFSWVEPDTELSPSIAKLLSIAHKVSLDKKLGIDSDERRQKYLAETGFLSRKKGRPSRENSFDIIRIKNTNTLQQALLVMLEQRGISTDESTINSVLATKISWQDHELLSPYYAHRELAKFWDEDAKKNENAIRIFAKNLYEEHQLKSATSNNQACINVSAWINKEPKSLNNACSRHREEVVLSIHFHAYLRNHENTLINKHIN